MRLLWCKVIVPILSVLLCGCQTMLPLKLSYTLNIGGQPDLKGYCKLTQEFISRNRWLYRKGQVVRVRALRRDEWNVLMCEINGASIPAHYLKKLSPLEVIEHRLEN